MLKKVIIAMVLAALATFGVIIPLPVVDVIVNFVVSDASASEVPLPIAGVRWEVLPFDFAADFIGETAVVGALRPPYDHSRSHRSYGAYLVPKSCFCTRIVVTPCEPARLMS